MSETERLIDNLIGWARDFEAANERGSSLYARKCEERVVDARAALLAHLAPEREALRSAVIEAATGLAAALQHEFIEDMLPLEEALIDLGLYEQFLDAAPASQATPPVVMITLTDDEHLVMLDALASHLDWLAETKRDYASAMRLYQRLGAEPVDRASAAPAAGDS